MSESVTCVGALGEATGAQSRVVTRGCDAQLTLRAVLFLPSIVGAWGLFSVVWLLRAVGGGAVIGLSFWCLAAFPLIFLFTAFIHQWQFINSACFTTISALRAKQLYDFVPLFDSSLALSHMHNCNEYFCPVYVYILYFIHFFLLLD